VKAWDKAVVERALDDYTTAPIPEPLRATLAYLKKLTLTPAEVGPEDVRPMLALGVTRAAVRDATYVCYLFSMYDRMADALDWRVPDADALEVIATRLLSKGYL
jgi:alkylhydroperoxidase family enzyme